MISFVNAFYLDIHLQGTDTALGTGNLEIHITQVIFITEDIGQARRNRSPSLIKPMAIPATGCLTGTPASIRASEVPQTEAMELEPLDSVISETTRST
jgi:hypothetical protein